MKIRFITEKGDFISVYQVTESFQFMGILTRVGATDWYFRAPEVSRRRYSLEILKAIAKKLEELNR